MEFNSILDGVFALPMTFPDRKRRQICSDLGRCVSEKILSGLHRKDTLIRDTQDLPYQQDFVRIKAPLSDLDPGNRDARNITAAEPEPGGQHAILS